MRTMRYVAGAGVPAAVDGADAHTPAALSHPDGHGHLGPGDRPRLARGRPSDGSARLGAAADGVRPRPPGRGAGGTCGQPGTSGGAGPGVLRGAGGGEGSGLGGTDGNGPSNDPRTGERVGGEGGRGGGGG